MQKKTRIHKNDNIATSLRPIPGVHEDYKIHPDGSVWKKASELILKAVNIRQQSQGPTYRVILLDGKARYISGAILTARAFHKAPPGQRIRIRYVNGNQDRTSAKNISWTPTAPDNLDNPDQLLTMHMYNPKKGRTVLMVMRFADNGHMTLRELPEHAAQVLLSI